MKQRRSIFTGSFDASTVCIMRDGLEKAHVPDFWDQFFNVEGTLCLGIPWVILPCTVLGAWSGRRTLCG